MGRALLGCGGPRDSSPPSQKRVASLSHYALMSCVVVLADFGGFGGVVGSVVLYVTTFFLLSHSGFSTLRFILGI